MPQSETKGRFIQTGLPQKVPVIDGSLMSVDGYVDFDVELVRTEYPRLFDVFNTTYNKPDTPATAFRTPTLVDWGITNAAGGEHVYLIKD